MLDQGDLFMWTEKTCEDVVPEIVTAYLVVRGADNTPGNRK